jgi:hypothetical protein
MLVPWNDPVGAVRVHAPSQDACPIDGDAPHRCVPTNPSMRESEKVRQRCAPLAAHRPYPPLADGRACASNQSADAKAAVLSLSCSDAHWHLNSYSTQMFTAEYVLIVTIRYNGNLLSSQFNLSLFGT